MFDGQMTTVCHTFGLEKNMLNIEFFVMTSIDHTSNMMRELHSSPRK